MMSIVKLKGMELTFDGYRRNSFIIYDTHSSHVCAYINMYTCVYTHVYIYTSICKHIYKHINIFLFMYIYLYYIMWEGRITGMGVAAHKLHPSFLSQLKFFWKNCTQQKTHTLYSSLWSSNKVSTTCYKYEGWAKTKGGKCVGSTQMRYTTRITPILMNDIRITYSQSKYSSDFTDWPAWVG